MKKTMRRICAIALTILLAVVPLSAQAAETCGAKTARLEQEYDAAREELGSIERTTAGLRGFLLHMVDRTRYQAQVQCLPSLIRLYMFEQRAWQLAAAATLDSRSTTSGIPRENLNQILSLGGMINDARDEAFMAALSEVRDGQEREASARREEGRDRFISALGGRNRKDYNTGDKYYWIGRDIIHCHDSGVLTICD